MLVCGDKKEEDIENGELGNEDIREFEEYEHMNKKPNAEEDGNLAQRKKLAQQLFSNDQFKQE